MQGENKLINECEILSKRIFAALQYQVFNAFEEPSLLKQWWGPKGFTNTFHQFNFVNAGAWDFTMHAPDGTDYYNEIIFDEIIKPWQITFTHLEPHHKFRGIITLEGIEGKTEFIFKMIFDSAEECQSVKSFILVANEENFDRLSTILSSVLK